MAKRVPELAKKNGLWRFEKRSSYLGFFSWRQGSAEILRRGRLG